MATQLKLRDYQENGFNQLRKGFGAGHRAQILYAPTGGGKSLRFDTKVIMSNGTTKAIQDVAIGDRLLGPDGGIRNVLDIGRGQETMYEISPVNGEPYYVNESHILSLKKTTGSDGLILSDGTKVPRDADIVNINVKTFEESNATVRHCLKGWKPEAVEFHRDAVDLEIDPYILGIWLGDGSSSGPTIHKPYCNLVKAWIEYGKSIGLDSFEYTKNGSCPAWRLAGSASGRGGNRAMDALKSLGLINNKHIPEAYKLGTVAQRLRLIAGMLDTDGHLKMAGYDWISKCRRMAEDFVFVCRSVGLSANVAVCQKGIKKTGFTGTYYRVSVTGDCDKIPCLDKKAPARLQKKRPLVTGISVKRLGVEDYYGVVLDGDHLFLLGDFTVTHNTELAIGMMAAAAIKDSRSAMVLDRIVLCDQTSARLDKYAIDHGVMQAGHWRHRPYEKIQVCSAQTLEKRGSFPGLNLLIIDEAHNIRSQTAEFLRNNLQVKAVGLTATPFTKGLGNLFSNMVITTTTKQLIDEGNLVPLKVFIAKEIDMAGAKKVAGEWSDKDASERGIKITGDVVSEWVKKTHEVFGGPRKTIVFCAGVAHGADLAEKFALAGYNFVPLSYKDDDEFKSDAFKEFAKPDSSIHGLIATDILTKGFDQPDVMIGISARPFSKSLSSHVQQLGRVMRSSPGKDFGLWLDHSGNYMRFKEDWDDVFVNGPGELDDGREKTKPEPTEAEKKESKCPVCGYLWGAEDMCPHCGHQRQRLNLVIAKPGEMEELVSDFVAKDGTVITRQDFYSELLYYSRTKGYKDGWAAIKFRDKFGVFPTGLNNVGRPISMHTRNWLTSQFIRQAKRRAA